MSKKSKQKPREEAVPREETAPRQEARPLQVEGHVTIPVLEERLKIDTRQVETGKVRLTKTVRTRTETVELPVVSEQLEVTRVPVNRQVDAPPGVRQEGETTIFPVLEEVLVVEKRLMLVEEIHVRRQRTEKVTTEKVTLRREEVRIDGTTNTRTDT